MNDDERDDLASRLLDGERLPIDPAAEGRRDELARARNALREVAPLDEVTRRRLVRTALDANPAPTVRHEGRAMRVLGAVAVTLVAVLVVGGIVAATMRDRGDDERAATTTDADTGTRADADAGSAEAASPTVRGLGDLGEIDGATDLARTLADGATPSPVRGWDPASWFRAPDPAAAGDEGSATEEPAESTTVERCAAAVGATAAGTLVYDGTPAVVALVDAGATAVVLATPTCTEVARVHL